jgi:tetraacyldisaccharide 4'-kinase
MRCFADALQAAWWQHGAAWPSTLLLPLAWLYRALLSVRGWAMTAQPAPVPVVVVGNLIVGGAGKTPATIALVQALAARGFKPGVVSRGYGARIDAPRAVRPDSRASKVGDEPLLIQRRTGVPVFVAPRRIDAALRLCASHADVNVIIADDGLQHLALQRQFQLIVFDARGIGNGRLLPAGPLRQPWTAQPPLKSVVVYNAEAPSTAWPGHLARRCLRAPVALKDWWSGRQETLDWSTWSGRSVIAAAGIAEPERFFCALRAHGLVVEGIGLPDHGSLEARPWPEGTMPVLVTEKDAARLDPAAADAGRIHVVPLDFDLHAAVIDAVVEALKS